MGIYLQFMPDLFNVWWSHVMELFENLLSPFSNADILWLLALQNLLALSGRESSEIASREQQTPDF